MIRSDLHNNRKNKLKPRSLVRLIKRVSTCLLGIIILCPAVPLRAQFVHLSMEVETEMSATTLQELDFGTYNPTRGNASVALGDPGMGIFVIRGLEYQNLMLQIDKPDYLTHTNPDVNHKIPINLEAAYNNYGVNETENARPIAGSQAFFTLYKNEEEHVFNINNISRQWVRAYIFIYGNLKLENARSGIYAGNVTITIEY